MSLIREEDGYPHVITGPTGFLFCELPVRSFVHLSMFFFPPLLSICRTALDARDANPLLVCLFILFITGACHAA